MYGTVFFEGIYHQEEIPKYIDQVLAIIDAPFEEQQKLFEYMNKRMQNINFQKKPNYLIDDDTLIDVDKNQQI